ncbi:MAG: twin-arginine translocase TatA/TatE family subunit [Desulfotignum sp.]|jgi:Tat protein translocase TatB subunit|nr:twin-arginine translocase TatA/TatE family subunit [Desulfotignum sp.]
MFGLGMPEILLILAIALIVIGPKKLPELAKTLGRAMGEFKRSAQDFKRSIDMETTLQDIHPASPDTKAVTRKSRQEKEDKNQQKSGQDKTAPPEDGPGDDSEAAPENDALSKGGTGDKKS